MAFDSRTLGLTYNIPDLILKSLPLDNVSHTSIIRSGVVGAGDFDKTYTDLALVFNMYKNKRLPWLRNNNQFGWAKCGVSNNAEVEVRQWPEIVDVKDEDRHHKPTSKQWCYNGPQNTTICSNNLNIGIRSNHKKKRRRIIYIAHHLQAPQWETFRGFKLWSFPSRPNTLNFMNEYGSNIRWSIHLDLL